MIEGHSPYKINMHPNLAGGVHHPKKPSHSYGVELCSKEWWDANNRAADNAMRAQGIWYGAKGTRPAPILVVPELPPLPEPPPSPPEPAKVTSEYQHGPGRSKLIIQVVGDTLGMHPEEITSEWRSNKIVRARRVIAHILVRCLGYSLPLAGRILRRDHSTILHSVLSLDKDDMEIVTVVIGKLTEAGIWQRWMGKAA
jgi:hypothetical protein